MENKEEKLINIKAYYIVITILVISVFLVGSQLWVSNTKNKKATETEMIVEQLKLKTKELDEEYLKLTEDTNNWVSLNKNNETIETLIKTIDSNKKKIIETNKNIQEIDSDTKELGR